MGKIVSDPDACFFNLVFCVLVYQKSAVAFVDNSVGLQVVNKLPQALDFYLINVDKVDKSTTLIPKHIGKIRPEYYRVEYLKMDKSDEYWIVGYLGKKNLVYFSQHAVPNKNIDQIVEVQNYINQSMKLSDAAKNKSMHIIMRIQNWESGLPSIFCFYFLIWYCF